MPSGIYNVGTGKPRSFFDVAKIVSSLTGANIEEIEFPTHLKGKYQEYTCSNNNKINTTDTDKLRLHLEAGIKEVYSFTDL